MAIAMCDMVDWTDWVHKFDIIFPRVWPWNVPDDRVVFSYEHMAAERDSHIAIVYDWLYPVLTKWERDKIRGALLPFGEKGTCRALCSHQPSTAG